MATPSAQNLIHHPHPHLSSWKTSLEEQIKNKENSLKHAESRLLVSEKRNEKIKAQLSAVKKEMNDVLIQVQQSMTSYIKGMQQGLNTALCELTKVPETGDTISMAPITSRGNILFKLFHDMHTQACRFYSKREFSSIPSPLQSETPEMNIKEQIMFFVDEFQREKGLQDEDWTDWLTPFWTNEEYFKTLHETHKQKNKLYTKILEEHQKLSDEVAKLTTELEALKQEHYEVNNFSNRLHKCRSSKDKSPVLKPDTPVTDNRVPDFEDAQPYYSDYSDESDNDSSSSQLSSS